MAQGIGGIGIAFDGYGRGADVGAMEDVDAESGSEVDYRITGNDKRGMELGEAVGGRLFAGELGGEVEAWNVGEGSGEFFAKTLPALDLSDSGVIVDVARCVGIFQSEPDRVVGDMSVDPQPEVVVGYIPIIL